MIALIISLEIWWLPSFIYIFSIVFQSSRDCYFYVFFLLFINISDGTKTFYNGFKNNERIDKCNEKHGVCENQMTWTAIFKETNDYFQKNRVISPLFGILNEWILYTNDVKIHSGWLCSNSSFRLTVFEWCKGIPICVLVLLQHCVRMT